MRDRYTGHLSGWQQPPPQNEPRMNASRDSSVRVSTLVFAALAVLATACAAATERDGHNYQVSSVEGGTECPGIYQRNLGTTEVFFDPCITWDGKCGAIFNGIVDLGLTLPQAYLGENDSGEPIWCVSLDEPADPVVDWGDEDDASPHEDCPVMDYGDFVLPGCCSSDQQCGGSNAPINGIYPPKADGTKPVQCLTWEEMTVLMSESMPKDHAATLPCQ